MVQVVEVDGEEREVPVNADWIIDVTDRVEVRQTGVIYECDCGQGVGLRFGVEGFKCPSCNKLHIDREYDEREEQSEEKYGDGQTALAQF